MSSEKETKHTNIWTILDKIKYFILAALFILIIIILSKGYSIETQYFKIGKVPDTLFIEKKVVIPADTVYKERIVTKYVEIPKIEKTTKVKNSDTEIEVTNQPSNINTGTNNGILGNNNTFNNITERPIELNNNDKINLINGVNSELKKTTNEKAKKIIVDGMLGNARSLQMATLIQEFLKSKGYDTGNGINQSVPSNPVKGVFIFADGEVVKINVRII
ncbi:hypothetical protein ACFQ1R_12955 [Mariniflexile jejuense]|uniref:Uncharacterized protein n=1 Tax=Mariniflexile jejuense TaxID=1173582 RepID=A0ABW3JMC6_9FLAO